MSTDSKKQPLLTPELLTQLERMELVSRKVFRGRMKGEKRSKRKGQSVEFADYRNYVAGDDLRFIDWNLYARLDKLFLKLFLEEEDLHFYSLIDVSQSMMFGDPTKLFYAKQLAAALGYIGLCRSDRVKIEPIGSKQAISAPTLRGRTSLHRMLDYLDSVEADATASLEQGIKSFAKMTLTGSTVWFKRAPVESGVYNDKEELSTKATWDRKSFLPTNFAFLDNGGFLLADGYGSYFIHEFDQHANWVRCFGGPGEAAGQFKLSHGLWVDRREGKTQSLYVTDRSRNAIQVLDMDGKHLETLEGFGLPANVDTLGDLMLVPELNGLVTILDKENKPLAKLGDGRARLKEVENLREKESQWTAGQFVHPHDACFDKEGNIFVAEWVKTGRVTKLSRV